MLLTGSSGIMGLPIICQYVLQESQMSPCCILGKCSLPLQPDCGNIFFARNIFTAEIIHHLVLYRIVLRGMTWNRELGAAPASSSYRKRWMCARAQWRTLGPSYWLVKDLVGEGSWQDMSGWLSCKAVSVFSACWLPGETRSLLCSSDSYLQLYGKMRR